MNSDMNSEFENWIITLHEQMGPVARQDFLRMLKSDPEKLEDIIEAHLQDDWGISFAMETGHAINNSRSYAQIAIAVFRQHFAAELAAITQ